MDITLDKKNSNEALIKIKLIEGDYQSKVAEKIKDYRKKAQIKGFRQGKVPTSLIEKMYGKSILIDEINHIVGHALQDYIRENDLKILGEPIPNQQQVETVDWENQSDFEFEYNIGLVEEFKVELSKKVKVTAYDINVDDKVIEESLENVREQFGKMTNPEVSEEGDLLYGTFKQTNGDIEHDTTFDPNQLTKTNAKKFFGKSSGAEIKVDLNKIIKDPATRAAQIGKTADEIEDLDGEFTFTIKNVNRKEQAELDQALFDQTFGPGVVTNEEEFRAKISETIGANYERETEAWLNKNVQDKLIEKTKINLPDAFLKDWLKLTGEDKVTDEDLDREYEIYANQLRWNLIAGKVAEENEVKPEHEDIMNATKAMIAQQFAGSGLGQMADQLDSFANNYLQGENGQNYMKMADQVRGEKVLALIKEKIDIKRDSVDVEKFKKIVEKN